MHAAGDLIDGRYEVREALSLGGMAEVYRARDRQSDRDVVLKVPHVSMAGDLAAFGRFRREIAIGRALDHPGVQHVLSDEQQRYAVLDYVQGESLRRYLARRGHLPLDEALDIGRQLADALNYVHQRGIVHRDVKPDNILIRPDGTVVLTDFGIASTRGNAWLRVPQLANAMGTPDYMAPEQVRGEPGDARTDVYGLASVVYELLTGCVPYPAEDMATAARTRHKTDPPLIRRVRPELPAAIEAVLYRALRRRPTERYPSMAAFATDLRNLDRVIVPATYEPDEPPPAPLGDLPPWRSTLPIAAITLGVLAGLGLLAECVHRAAPPR